MFELTEGIEDLYTKVNEPYVRRRQLAMRDARNLDD